jgi:membrane-associated phospholipid phosphatase
MPWPKLRTSEWILVGFFSYVAIIGHRFHLRPHLQLRSALILTSVVALLWLLSVLESTRWRVPVSIARDFVPVGLTLVAFREMELFLPISFDHRLEMSWIGWDRLFLDHWRARAIIESLGATLPLYLELCYVLVYGLPFYCLAILYTRGRRSLVDRFLIVYLTGTLAAYALFPYFPSQPPRLVFPHADLPAATNFLRRFNLAILNAATIHVGVFPSAHVSSAFAAAWGMFLAFPKRKLFGWILLVYACSVSISTIYGRYHYSADVLAGIALSLTAAAIAYLLARRTASKAAQIPADKRLPTY